MGYLLRAGSVPEDLALLPLQTMTAGFSSVWILSEIFFSSANCELQLQLLEPDDNSLCNQLAWLGSAWAVPLRWLDFRMMSPSESFSPECASTGVRFNWSSDHLEFGGSYRDAPKME
jgi:hypothetical protein